MKKLISTLAYWLIITSLFAQVPEKMSYQAVVRNASGELVKNQSIGVQVTITKGSFLPTVKYQETHVVTTNVNGLVTLEIGGGTPVVGTLAAIDWASGSHYVSTNYDFSGGTNFSGLASMPAQLLSVPYALYAKSAGNASGGNACPDGTAVGEIKYWNGTSWISVTPALDGRVLALEGGLPVWKELQSSISLPTVSTSAVSITTTSQTNFSGYVVADGGGTIAERGFCYGTNQNPTVQNSIVACGSGLGSFNATVPELTPATDYYVRAYATNSAGTMYGNEVAFTTSSPVFSISTGNITNITDNSVTVEGNIVGGNYTSLVSLRWKVLIGLSPELLFDNNFTAAEPANIGNNLSNIGGLTPGTKYYARTCAIGMQGSTIKEIVYGAVVSFTTSNSTSSEFSIRTQRITNITKNSVTIEGYINGGSSYDASGSLYWKVLYGLTPNLSFNGAYLVSGDRANNRTTLSRTITGLTPGTKYYVRTCAIGMVGSTVEETVYDEELSFTTLPDETGTVPEAPTIGIATAGEGRALVSYTAPSSNGGTAITSYTATSSPGGLTGTLTQAGSGTISVSGLTNGIAYTFTVTATNAVGTSAASAASNSVTPTVGSSSIKVGDSYGGGIVAYILQSGDPGFVAGETHGLIAAPTDQVYIAGQGKVDWLPDGLGEFSFIKTGATATTLGAGSSNTDKVVTTMGAGSYAAKLCADLVLDSYSDWYLPSKDELNKLYLYKNVIGGFVDNYYWSSSSSEIEVSGQTYQNYTTYALHFGTGASTLQARGNKYNVRPVRSF